MIQYDFDEEFLEHDHRIGLMLACEKAGKSSFKSRSVFFGNTIDWRLDHGKGPRQGGHVAHVLRQILPRVIRDVDVAEVKISSVQFVNVLFANQQQIAGNEPAGSHGKDVIDRSCQDITEL